MKENQKNGRFWPRAWKAIGILSAIFVFLTSVGPEDAGSRLRGWWEALFVETPPPQWLVPRADTVVLYISILGLMWFAYQYSKQRRQIKSMRLAMKLQREWHDLHVGLVKSVNAGKPIKEMVAQIRAAQSVGNRLVDQLIGRKQANPGNASEQVKSESVPDQQRE